LAIYAAGFVAGIGSGFLTQPCSAVPDNARYELAVVLGAGVTEKGNIGGHSAWRARAAADLHARGIAERLHMTGSGFPDLGIAAADGMRDLAVRRGVPAEAITVERTSESTLENALFSVPQVDPHSPRILVTSGFHLWRGAASLAWAGTPVDAMCHSHRFDRHFRVLRMLRWGHYEGIRWPINVVRAGVWSAAATVGAEGWLPDWWLF